MAKEKDWLYEEDGCADCGEIEYTNSKVEGLCQECLDIETGTGESNEVVQEVVEVYNSL
jgi:hypothetical protein